MKSVHPCHLLALHDDRGRYDLLRHQVADVMLGLLLRKLQGPWNGHTDACLATKDLRILIIDEVEKVQWSLAHPKEKRIG